MRLCRTVIALILLVVFLQSAPAQDRRATQSPASVVVDATSGLFGYFRLPDHQDLEWISVQEKSAPQSGFFCPSDVNTASPDARVFLTLPAPNNRLLVGTGDNFAPNYGSRMFTDDPKKSSKTMFADGHHEKELYNWDWTRNEWTYYDGRHWDSNKLEWVPTNEIQGEDMIPTDNVACFLSYAGYAAIVPGKHDFQYGTERLRALARLLASLDQPGFSKVQMLGRS